MKVGRFSEKAINYQQGQAALVAVVFFLFISLIILGSFMALSVSQLSNANELITGKKAFATLESGIDDITIRALSSGYEYKSTLVPGETEVYQVSYEAGGDYPFANGGASEIIIDTSEAQGELPHIFDVNALGNVDSRIRKSFYRFIIPDEKLAVSVKSAIQAGYIGAILNHDTQIHSTAGFKQGDVFSNGSIVSESGIPVINGNAIVARGVGKLPHQAHNCSADQVDGVEYCPGSTMGSSIMPVTFPKANCTSINDTPDDSGNCGGFHINEFMQGANGPGLLVASDDGQLPARDGAQSFISSITGTIRKVRLLVGCHSNANPIADPPCSDVKGGLSLQIKPNVRMTKTNGSVPGYSWARGQICSKDPWGRDFIDIDGDGMWDWNDEDTNGIWSPPELGGLDTVKEAVDGMNWTSTCIDMPFTGVSSVANVSVTQDWLSNRISAKDTYYWLDFELANTGELTMDAKYWILLEDGCTNSCAGNDEEYWLLGGTNVEGYHADYTVGTTINTNDRNTAWNYELKPDVSSAGSSGDPGAFVLFNDYRQGTSDFRFIDKGAKYEDFDIAFEVFLGEEKTSLSSASVPNNYAYTKRGERNTQGGQLYIVGDARAEHVSAIDVGGKVYYETIDTLTSKNEVKAGGEWYNETDPREPPLPGDLLYPAITTYPQTTFANIDDVNYPGLKRHFLKTAQRVCPDEFDLPGYEPPTPPTWPDYIMGKNYSRDPILSPTNSNALQWGSSCDAPYYAADNRWACWDFFCSCNNGNHAVPGGPASVEADDPVNDNDSGVDDVFCENVDDEAKYSGLQPGDDDYPIPDPEQAFGVQGVVLNHAKLVELKKKAMSLGIQDVTELPNGRLTLSSPDGRGATTTWPGITPNDYPDNNYFEDCFPAHSPPEGCDDFQHWNVYNREEFVDVNGVQPPNDLYGGYIIGDVTINKHTGVRLAGRVTQDVYDHFWVGQTGTTTPAEDIVDKCPYNVRHDGEVIGASVIDGDEPCYVLWITGDLTITGKEASLTALPPTYANCDDSIWHPGTNHGIYGPPESCDIADLEYSIFIIVEGDVDVTQGAHIYGFPHPQGRSGVFIVSLEPDTGTTEGAVKIAGKARGSAFFAYRGTLTGSEQTHIKALVAAGIKTSGDSEIFFDEGLKSPFTESGGSQLTGANIKKYREVD